MRAHSPADYSPSLTLGIGQQPYFPVGSSQQVEPSGHWECPSGHKITGRGEKSEGQPGWRGQSLQLSPAAVRKGLFSPQTHTSLPELLVLCAGIFLARGWVPVAERQRP